tara:strand:+ start:1298 stop:1603 length:306 start_codon:yes stop_codon:yes gene_type:complete
MDKVQEMRGDKDNALACNWERDDCDGHTTEWPSMCEDCLVSFAWDIDADDGVYIIEHPDLDNELDLPQLLWVKEVRRDETWFIPVVDATVDLVTAFQTRGA